MTAGQDMSPKSLQIRALTPASALGAALIVAVVVPISPVMALGVAAAIVVLISPTVGLALLVFLTWTRLSDALASATGAPSISTPFMALLALVVIGRWAVLGERPGRWWGPALLLLAYALMVVGSLLHADGYEAALAEAVEFGKSAVVFVLALSLITTPQRLRTAVWALVVAGALLGTLTVIQYVTGDFSNTFYGLAQAHVQQIVGELDEHRASGPGVGPNGYAQIMLIVLPLAVERALRDPWRWARPVAGAAAAAAGAAVVLTFSRQALIAMTVIAAATAALTRVDLRKLVAVTVVAVTLVFFLAPHGYLERLGTLTDLSPTTEEAITAEGSYRGRLSEYIVGVQMFADSPVIGMGLGNYNHLYQEYARPIGLESRRTGRSPHSLYLEFASELGVLGLVWLAALNVVAFRGLRHATAVWMRRGDRSFASMSLALQISLIGYLTTSLLRHMAFPRYFWLFYAIVLSVPLVADRRPKSRSPEAAE